MSALYPNIFPLESKKAMILYVLSLLFFWNCSLLQAQQINFKTNSLNKALKEAQKTDKLIFVDAYTSWCQPCKWMDKQVFTNRQVAQFYNSRFINLKLDMEKGKGIDFASDYNIGVFPSLVFLDGQGRVVHKAYGARDVKDLLKLGVTALSPEKNLGYFKNAYLEKCSNSDFLYQYSRLLWDIDSPELLEVSGQYILSNPELLEEEHIQFIFSILPCELDHPLLNHVLENLEMYFTHIGKDSVEQILLSCAIRIFENPDTHSDVEEYFNHFTGKDAQKLFLEFEILNLLNEEEPSSVFEELAERAKEYDQLGVSVEPELSNNIAWYLQANAPDLNILLLAKKYAEDSVVKDPHFQNHDTLAHILYQLKHYGKALEMVDKALVFASKHGISSRGTVILKAEIMKKMNK